MLENVKIGRKLTLGFAVAAAVAVAVGLAGVYGTRVVASNLDVIVTQEVPAQDALRAIAQGQNAILVAERGLLNRRMSERDGFRPAQYAWIDDHWKIIDEALATFEAREHTAAEKAQWAAFRGHFDDWKKNHQVVRQINEEIDRAGAAGDREQKVEAEGRALDASLAARTHFLQCAKDLHGLIDEGQKAVDASVAAAKSAARRSLLTVIVVALLGTVGLQVFGVWLARSIAQPLRQGVAFVRELAQGRLGTRLRLQRQDEVGELAGIMDTFADGLKEVVTVLDGVSRGDLSKTLAPRDAQDEVVPALNRTVEALRGLVDETAALTQAAVQGQLATRGKADRFEGGYRQIVGGINDTLDAVIGPLNVAAEYVDRIGKGDIPPRITEDYRGDFAEIRNNLNLCIDAVNALQADAKALTAAAAAGDFRTRADESRHAGDYRAIVRGINATLDTVVQRGHWYEQILDAVPFPLSVTDAEMKWTFINRATEQALGRKRADVVGRPCREWGASICGTADCGVTCLRGGRPRTSFRHADSHFQVDTSLLVDAAGKTVGHVELVQDVTAAERVAAYQQQEIERLAGNLCQLADGDIGLDLSVGDSDEHTAALRANFEVINMSLERVQVAVATMMGEMDALSKAIVRGRLDTRADASTLSGGFSRIVEGVNRALGTVVQNLEAVPTPIQFIDTEFRLQYINAAGAALLGRSKAELQSGLKCGEMWRTTKCSTGECPCAVAMRENGTHQCANDLTMAGRRLDIACAAAPLRDEDGAVIGSFEFVTDQSEVVTAVRRAEKIVAYQDRECARVAGGIEQLAAGEFAAQLEVADADPDTAEAKAALERILAAVRTFKGAVVTMAEDVGRLSHAAVAGELSTRADAGRHRGEFAKIVAGLNATLDAAINPVTEAAAVLEKVAVRDLTARVEGRYQGDHARIKTALNQAVANLDEGLQNVAAASQQVASAAGQISTQSQSMAQGSSEQASSLEEISASLAEMESMTRQNSDNAHRARQMADAALSDAARGRSSMDRLSTAIEKIKASSDATAKIVKTIDEIAFQTNLLALNAAVEAARAGDAGKGFAVVAEEVRNLAMRSAESAKNTAQLIEEAVRNAESGVQVETEVQKALAEINDHARRVSEVMAEIAAASEQQTTGIAQINTAIGQMNELTQSSAASSEESASVAEELSGQAQELQGLVGAFQLSGRASASSRPAFATPSLPVPPPAPSRAARASAPAAPPRPRPESGKGSAREIIPLDDGDLDKLSSF